MVVLLVDVCYSLLNVFVSWLLMVVCSLSFAVWNLGCWCLAFGVSVLCVRFRVCFVALCLVRVVCWFARWCFLVVG